MNNEKMREIYSVVRMKKGFDKLSVAQVKKLCGHYWPCEDDTWEVNLMFDGEGYSAKTQFEAVVISSLEQIKALCVKFNRPIKGEGQDEKRN